MSYPGGKGASYRQIIARMPRHSTYVELFGGSGAVLRHKRPAAESFVMDIDADAVAELAAWRDSSARGDALVRVFKQSAIDWLDCHPPAGHSPGCLYYADPPYLFSARRSARPMYAHEFGTDHEHRALLERLLRLQAPVMLSGYRCELYDELVGHWRRVDYTATTRHGAVAESLWMNFEAPDVLHDYGPIGDDYRERERIRKQQRRWAVRFGRMPLDERRAMARQLIGTLPVHELADALVDVCGTADLGDELNPIPPALIPDPHLVPPPDPAVAADTASSGGSSSRNDT